VTVPCHYEVVNSYDSAMWHLCRGESKFGLLCHSAVYSKNKYWVA